VQRIQDLRVREPFAIPLTAQPSERGQIVLAPLRPPR
jgi:hypothetical protein